MKREEFEHIMRFIRVEIDLSGKILVFLGSPDPKTFRILYPILSQDRMRVEYRFTNKTPKGKLRTMRVVIEGWPATVFLSTERRYVEEIATRCLTLQPQDSVEKIRGAVNILFTYASEPWLKRVETKEEKMIKEAVKDARDIFLYGKVDVVIPFKNIVKYLPKQEIRDIRGTQHFIQLVSAYTALNCLSRPILALSKGREATRYA